MVCWRFGRGFAEPLELERRMRRGVAGQLRGALEAVLVVAATEDRRGHYASVPRQAVPMGLELDRQARRRIG